MGDFSRVLSVYRVKPFVESNVQNMSETTAPSDAKGDDNQTLDELWESDFEIIEADSGSIVMQTTYSSAETSRAAEIESKHKVDSPITPHQAKETTIAKEKQPIKKDDDLIREVQRLRLECARLREQVKKLGGSDACVHPDADTDGSDECVPPSTEVSVNECIRSHSAQGSDKTSESSIDPMAGIVTCSVQGYNGFVTSATISGASGSGTTMISTLMPSFFSTGFSPISLTML